MTSPAVVFDVGNVLLDWDPRHLYRTVFDDPEKMEWFLAHICTPAWNTEQDRGRSWADAVRELTRRHPEWSAEIAVFDSRWRETVAGGIEPSVTILRQLAARQHPVYAITNFSGEKWPIAQADYDFLNLFRGVVVSGDEKMLKPDTRIYHTLLTRYDLRAEHCIFIDDSQANIAGAQAVGMKTIHFDRTVHLRAELSKLGVNL